MPLITSQLLQNRCRIVKLIGQGGFGVVYRAWDTAINQPFSKDSSTWWAARRTLLCSPAEVSQ